MCLADSGRRGVSPGVLDVGRRLGEVCRRWYPVVCDLHRRFLHPRVIRFLPELPETSLTSGTVLFQHQATSNSSRYVFQVLGRCDTPEFHW